jgi:hypothetical protein
MNERIAECKDRGSSETVVVLLIRIRRLAPPNPWRSGACAPEPLSAAKTCG